MSNAPPTVSALGYSATSPPRESRLRVAACFVLLLAAIQLVAGPKIRVSQWGVLTAESNGGIAEGLAWMHGRLDVGILGTNRIDNRLHDTAWYRGHAYSVHPPMMGVLTVLLSPLHEYMLGHEDAWHPWTFILLVFWPLPLVGFIVFRRLAGDSAWAALLALAWIAGTAVLPNLNLIRTSYGYLGGTYHVWSQVGLLIFVADMLGRRRIWPSMIGLWIAVWTRPMTAIYAIPLLVIAWRRGRLGQCLAGLAMIATPLLALNYFKFGNAFDSGYRHMYVGREHEAVAQRVAQYGLFNWKYAVMPVADMAHSNLYYMHAALPDVEDVEFNTLVVRPDWYGCSIWLTTPLLLWVVFGARWWWRDSVRRILMLSTLAVMAALLCYHDPGFSQFGYNRFALDFIPIWLAVIAMWTRRGWRSWASVVCIAWSLLYFQMIVPEQPVVIEPRTTTTATPVR